MTFAVNTESTYDWVDEEWTVPLNMKVSKLVVLGGQRVSLAATARYWLDDPDGWGVTLGATLLFPK